MTHDILLSICVTFPGIKTFVVTSICSFHSRTVHLDIIKVLLPTDAQGNALKDY